jgi:hypothetical protein
MLTSILGARLRWSQRPDWPRRILSDEGYFVVP